MGGIHAEDGRDLMVAEDADGFRRCLEELLSRPDRARAMGRAARDYILRNLSWEADLESGLLPLLP
jgi:hypothetical protein